MSMIARCAAAALCLFACGTSALRAEKHVDIVPEMPEDMLAKGIDMTSMNLLKIKAFDGSDKYHTIAGYPVEEDREISGSLEYDSNWEPFHTRELCSPWTEHHHQGFFLDIGANIGTYSIPMASCIAPGGNGSVISVEAVPDIADHFRAGVIKNDLDNVVLYPYALGSPSGPEFITMTLDPANKGGSSVLGNKEGDKSLLKAGVKEVKVPLTTLDTLLKNDRRLEAVLSAKIDIEGNEGRLLQGAEEFFSKHPPCYLMIELIHEWLDSAGTPLQDILAKLEGWGYHPRYMPTYEHLTHCAWRQRTVHIFQKDREACFERVGKAYSEVM